MTPVLTLVLLAGPARAGELDLGAYVGHQATPAAADFPSTGTAGVRLRYRFDDHWAAEVAVGGLDGALDPRVHLQHFFGDDPYENVRLFAEGGFGAYLADNTGHDLWEAGLGMNAALFPALDFRADLLYRVIRTEGSEAWPKRSEGGFYTAVGLELHPARVRPPPPPPPDTDGDGLLDPVDPCPALPEDLDGYADQDGCPDPDNDLDGVLDAADACPLEVEDRDAFADDDGCPDPDNDADRIPDTSDAAPNAPETYNGYQDRDGAPDELPAAVVKFSGKIEGIKFDTGKATIQKTSNKVLDEAAAVLVQFPDIRLEVQGHTDDVGDDAKNLDLSQRRAQAVVDYLVGKGVDSARLTPRGYGETKPVVPNDSAANRALNRRVEFQIVR